MVRSSLRSLPTSKAVAALGAAVLMVGGGVAAAQNALPSQQDDVDATEDSPADEAPEELGDQAPVVAPEETPDDVTEVPSEEAPEEGGDEAPEEPIDETPEENAVEETPEAPEDNVVEEAPDSDEGDEPSDTARRVHEALSGDPDISPGHPEFGAKVSERAREGGLGNEVSRAARGLDGEPDDDQQDASTPSDRRGENSSTDDRPGAGPPAWANNDGQKATPPGRR